MTSRYQTMTRKQLIHEEARYDPFCYGRSKGQLLYALRKREQEAESQRGIMTVYAKEHDHGLVEVVVVLSGTVIDQFGIANGKECWWDCMKFSRIGKGVTAGGLQRQGYLPTQCAAILARVEKRLPHLSTMQ